MAYVVDGRIPAFGITGRVPLGIHASGKSFDG